MKGIGSSVRERAEASYWQHTKEAYLTIMGASDWAWREWWEALGSLASLPLLLLLVFFFPVTVPLAGLTRMVFARKRFKKIQSNAFHK